MLHHILHCYGIDETTARVEPFGSGLINHTWIIRTGESTYILQRINQNVFKAPQDIADNTRVIGEWLAAHHPDYLFVGATKTIQQEDMVYSPGEGYFRLFPFVKNSHTITIVNTPSQAYEAALQFGRFTSLLSDFPATTLKTTLPDFHNLGLRYQQFDNALLQGNQTRLDAARQLIGYLKDQQEILVISERVKISPAFKQRVTHHDTKISNVLFDNNDKGLCVIDLDTVMAGHFISDVGDMIRTYTSPVSEEEADFDRIQIREDYFQAIVAGYLQEMGPILTGEEKDHFIYAGKFMIYMQALRFLTDHLLDDVYYGARYEGHNYNRAFNQAILLQRLTEKENKLNTLIQAL